MTEIYIETDVFQTWQFDFTYLKSFVERKHVTDDLVGKHTILEGIATGEYIVNSFDYYNELNEVYYIVQVTKLIDGTEATTKNYGGIPFVR